MAGIGISQFDGMSNVDMDSHFNQIEAYFVLKDITEPERRVACLNLSLTGEARRFFSSLPLEQQKQYEIAKEALQDRFKIRKSCVVFQQELADRTQKPGESVLELKYAIYELVDKAYPEVDTDARNVIKTASFRKALNSDIRRKVAWILPENASVDDIIHKVDQINREENTGISVNSISTVESKTKELELKLEQLCKIQEEMANVVAAISRDKGPSRGRRSMGPCYVCGDLGHYARQCTAEKKCRKCGRRNHFTSECRNRNSYSYNQGN